MNLIDEINNEIKAMGIPPVSPPTKATLVQEETETKVKVEPVKRKRGRPAKVSNEIFVEMWNAALEQGSLGEVASSLGISRASCAVKASNMRKAGFNLPQFKRGRPRKQQ